MHTALRTTLLSALVFFSTARGFGRDESPEVPVQLLQSRQDTEDSLQESARILLWPDSAEEGVSLRPRLCWRTIPEAVQYVLQVSQDTSFAGPFLRESVCTDTAFVLDWMLNNATRYYWRVGMAGRDSAVAFSPMLTFVTGPPPSSRPVIIPDSRRDETTVACAVLHNHGVLPVTLDSLSHHPRLTSGTRLPTVVAPGDSLVLQYSYHPRAFGTEVDTVMLYTDEGRCAIPVSAQCSPPVLHSLQEEATLGPVAIDDSAASVLTFVNAGPTNRLTVRRVRTRTQFFSASFLPLRVIEPGDTLRVPVRFHLRAFRPDGFGTYADTCLIESDGGNGRVVLSGDSPSPRLWLEPPMVSFGDVAVHDTAFATVRLMNRSVNAARIDSVRNRNRVFRPMTGKMRVGPSDTASFVLRYTPAQCGTYSDTLVLYNNSWRGPVRVPVVGVAPFPILETGFARLDFGSVARGDTAGVVLRLSNGSISRLRVESVRTKTYVFRVTSPELPAFIGKGDSVRVPLVFMPDSIRHFSDTLVIVSNAAGSPHRIPLTGDGIPPGLVAGRSGTPGAFELFQNFPNPFSTSTTFRYALPEPCHVRLEIFTTLGQQVALLMDGDQDAGLQNVGWSTDVTSGMYYYRLTATPRGNPGKQYVGTRKMIVMR